MASVTVLLVEDDHLVRRVTERMLRKLGHQVLTAESPSEAIAVLSAHAESVELVLTDAQLPEMTGQELMGRLLAIRPSLRVIIMSGANVQLDPRATFVPTILAKPFLTAALAAKVEEALAKKPDLL